MCVLQQAWVLLSVVVCVSFEGQMWRMVTDAHQEDDDGAEGHHRGNQEETETVHRTGDTAPVIFLLRREPITNWFYMNIILLYVAKVLHLTHLSLSA